MIQNVIFVIIFLEILFRVYNLFYIRPDVPADIFRIYF